MVANKTTVPAEMPTAPSAAVLLMTRATVSVLPAAPASVTPTLLPRLNALPAASVPLPVLLTMVAPVVSVTVLATLAVLVMSSALPPSAMVPVPALAVAPATRSVPLPTVVVPS